MRRKATKPDGIRRVVLFLLMLGIMMAGGAVDTRAAPVVRIVGGEDALPGSWPWITALTSNDTDTLFQAQNCAGSLIDPEWVLTAAHCVTSSLGNPLETDELAVVVGVYNLEADPDNRIGVKRVIPHPDFDVYAENDSDIALVQLENPVSFPTVPIVDDNIDLGGENGFILGWGNTSTDTSDYPVVLQQASIPVVSNAECNRAYNLDFFYDDPITQNMICAGYIDGGVDTCQGDSGGPLVVRIGGTWHLAGITSWGEGCSLPGYYGVYTRVSKFTGFINGYLAGTFNGTPTAIEDSYPISRGDRLYIPPSGVLANDYDPENDPLSAVLYEGVLHGELTLNSDGSFTYQHDGGDDQIDSFTYRATDGFTQSEPTTVFFSIGGGDVPVNFTDEEEGGGGCFINNVFGRKNRFAGFGGP